MKYLSIFTCGVLIAWALSACKSRVGSTVSDSTPEGAEAPAQEGQSAFQRMLPEFDKEPTQRTRLSAVWDFVYDSEKEEKFNAMRGRSHDDSTVYTMNGVELRVVSRGEDQDYYGSSIEVENLNLYFGEAVTEIQRLYQAARDKLRQEYALRGTNMPSRQERKIEQGDRWNETIAGLVQQNRLAAVFGLQALYEAARVLMWCQRVGHKPREGEEHLHHMSYFESRGTAVYYLWYELYDLITFYDELTAYNSEREATWSYTFSPLTNSPSERRFNFTNSPASTNTGTKTSGVDEALNEVLLNPIREDLAKFREEHGVFTKGQQVILRDLEVDFLPRLDELASRGDSAGDRYPWPTDAAVQSIRDLHDSFNAARGAGDGGTSCGQDPQRTPGGYCYSTIDGRRVRVRGSCCR